MPAAPNSKYTVRIINFFNYGAESHPRNLKLDFPRFCPDSAAPDAFLVSSMMKWEVNPWLYGVIQISGKSKSTSPSRFLQTPAGCLQTAAFQISLQMALNPLLAVWVEHGIVEISD